MGKGGTILGTSRTNPYKKENGVPAVLETFKKLGLDALIAMGGEDTLGVAAKLYKEHKCHVVGVPKTMDNDLSATDFTFGFDTAATLAMEAGERLVDTGRSHRRIMVLEVMGRHAGWVALYTAMGAGADYVCLPERQVDVDDMIRSPQGRARAQESRLGGRLRGRGPGRKGQEELDEFGHMILKKRGVAEKLSELIEKKTGIETRSAVIGHMQRGGAPTLFDRILGTRVGVKAAELVAEGKFGQMVALRGNEVLGVPLDKATADFEDRPGRVAGAGGLGLHGQAAKARRAASPDRPWPSPRNSSAAPSWSSASCSSSTWGWCS